MWDKPNIVVSNMWHSYMLQPGDATLYRFGFCYYPVDQEEAYVLDSGVGPQGYREYVKLYINMPSGVGMGTLLLSQLEDFPKQTHILGYLKGWGHGFVETDMYTLIAVLLAMKVLVERTMAVEEAAKAMLKAREIIMKINKGEE